MLEMFRCELKEAKEQATLTLKPEKGHGKSGENCTAVALYSASKLGN